MTTKTLVHRLFFPLLLILGGCSTSIPLPPDQPTANAGQSRDAWRQVIERHVDAAGKVDFAAVDKDRQLLERWLGYVAEHGPNRRVNGATGPFATKAQRLSFYLDAYNALAMYGVLTAGVLPEDKVRFFLLRKYRVGGEWMSLYYLENELIRAEGDPRIHFALNCMSASCPRLPQVPWRVETLDEQLDAATREFVNDRRHVRVDHGAQIVWLSAIFDFYDDDFGPLRDYVDRYRDTPLPASYRLKFMPYDWSLNSQ